MGHNKEPISMMSKSLYSWSDKDSAVYMASLLWGISSAFIQGSLSFQAILLISFLAFIVYLFPKNDLKPIPCALVACYSTIAFITSAYFSPTSFSWGTKELIAGVAIITLISRRDMSVVHFSKAIQGVAIGGVVGIFLSFLLSITEFNGPSGRLASDNYHPNAIAATGATAALVSLFHFHRKMPNTPHSFVSLAIGAAGFALIIVARSRTSLFIFSLLFFYSLLSSLSLNNLRRTMVFSFCIIAIVIVALTFSDSISEYLEIYSASRSLSSGTGRFEMWEFVLENIIPDNAIFGIGGDSYANMMMNRYNVAGAHNIIIDQLARCGLLANAFYVSMVLLAFMGLTKIDSDRPLLLSIFFFGLLASMAELRFIGLAHPGAVAVLFAVCCGLKYHSQKAIAYSRNDLQSPH